MSDSQIPDYLFAYCERAGDAGLWAEPLNAITNLAFLAYAWLGYTWIMRLPDRSFRAIGDIWILVLALVLIGLGSGLWHIWAAPGWTVIVDTIPIYLFINVYFFSMFRRLFRFSWARCAWLWVAFTALSTLVQQSLPMDTLNGSLMYIPTFLLMLLSGVYLQRICAASGRTMLALSGLFLLSLVFRTADAALCSSIPIGTHFIWHCLNAVLLYKLVVLLQPQKNQQIGLPLS